MIETNGPRRFPAGRFPKHPIFDLLREQGRQLTWLARRARYSKSHVHNVSAGVFPASAEFRRRCAEVMELPERDLFHETTRDPADEAVA